MKIFYLLMILLSIGFCKTANAQEPLPTESSTLFSGSGNCDACHFSNGAVLTYNGVDVSMVTYWRSTMMGNASKDPLWRAYVASEVEQFPLLQETIETKCTKCHAPMGYTQAIYNGQSNYSMNELRQDRLANDGVSCTVCHQIDPSNFGTQESYSGGYIITDDRIIYGPYQNPDTVYMQSFVEYTPKFGDHINQAELCATCHTLFSPTVNDLGEIVGDFPEQTPYIEWKNSIYPAQDTPCQTCHMPKIYDPIDIAVIPEFDTTKRSPFWKHNFVGGNTMMLKILKQFTDSLHVTAESFHFDSTIFRAEENLKVNASNISLQAGYINDSIDIGIKIENLAGHKLPTGIPLRRMWVHFKIADAFGTKIFESGAWDSEGRIIGMNADYEPHYNSISNESEVQIYEGVLQDLNEQVTYTLLKAASFKKDNRIPPKGFTSQHISYDTTAITQDAFNDPDFNRENNVEGSGSDVIHYRLPVTGDQLINISAELCYQLLKPEISDHFSNLTSSDITTFLDMYSGADKEPVVMKSIFESILVSDLITENNLTPNEFSLEQNYPNPFNPSTKISWQSPVGGQQSIKVYDVLGNEVAVLVDEFRQAGKYEVEFNASLLSSGIYFYTLKAGSFIETKKLILLK